MQDDISGRRRESLIPRFSRWFARLVVQTFGRLNKVPIRGDSNARISRPIPGWAPSTPAVEPASLEAVLAEHAAVVVHFWAPWNGWDIATDQVIQAITPEFAGLVHFCSCNVDLPENQPLWKQSKVGSIPFLAVFVRGRSCRPILGFREPAHLAKELAARLPEGPHKACGT